MKALSFVPLRLLQNSKFCLFGIAVGLSALHLLLTWRVIGDIDRMIVSVIFWGAILCLLWRKQDNLDLESGIFSSFFGLLLMVLVLVKSISLFWFESSFLKLAPLLLASGLGLLASGFKGLKQYWRELTFVLLLCLPENLLSQIIEEIFKVTTLTATFATFVLWYLGFEVSRQGVNIIFPHDTVLVAAPCTGISTALLLLKLAIVFILMFPINWSKKLLVAIAAVFIALLAGGMRVALMAAVVSNQQAFDYWHGPEGNQIFSTISILFFGLLCRILLQPNENESASLDCVEL